MIEDRYGDVRGPDPGEPATSVSRVHSGKRRTNGYVMLDSTWARQLGVRRSGGVYRIGRRKLMDRLKELQQIPTQGGGDLTANVELHSHFVGFYETEKFLVDSVLDFLAPGLRAGDAAIVVANEAHRHSVDSALMAAGIDLPEARGCGRYIALDASEALGTFMVGGRPDAARFKIATAAATTPLGLPPSSRSVTRRSRSLKRTASGVACPSSTSARWRRWTDLGRLSTRRSPTLAGRCRPAELSGAVPSR